MTYSIIARDSNTGQMGVATQTQALAVGSSVPWALPGYGVIATQSVGEPMYGELGLDILRSGLTAAEALAALRSVDPFPERRQVAMLDSYGGIDVYTGDACVREAGHRLGERCAALANMVVSRDVWESMVDAYEHREAGGTGLAGRLLAALRAAEEHGGDLRGRRSAAITVVRAERTGRPWRDHLVDLRVDDDPDSLRELERLVGLNDRYHRMVETLERALDGDPGGALAALDDLPAPEPSSQPDLAMWRALVLAVGGRDAEAASVFRELDAVAPRFVETARRFAPAGLVPPEMLADVLPGGLQESSDGDGPAGPDLPAQPPRSSSADSDEESSSADW